MFRSLKQKKTLKINLIFWLAFICHFGSFSIKAQNYSVYIADSLFHAYQFEEAALEYEKCVFKNMDSSIKEYALMQRAYCFKNSGKYYEAYQNFQRLDIDNYNDSLKCVYNFQIGLMLYLSNYFNDADSYLQRNFNLPITTLEYKNSILLNVLVLNELFKYSEARNKLSVYAINYTKTPIKDSIVSIIDKDYSNEKIPKIKSIHKARKLSKVLPGAGLIYIGKSGRALGNGRDDGFTKIITDKNTHRIIGAAIVGAGAGELLAETCLAIEMDCDIHDVALTVHAHQTLSESVAFACEIVDGSITDLYMPKKKK